MIHLGYYRYYCNKKIENFKLLDLRHTFAEIGCYRVSNFNPEYEKNVLQVLASQMHDDNRAASDCIIPLISQKS